MSPKKCLGLESMGRVQYTPREENENEKKVEVAAYSL